MELIKQIKQGMALMGPSITRYPGQNSNNWFRKGVGSD